MPILFEFGLIFRLLVHVHLFDDRYVLTMKADVRHHERGPPTSDDTRLVEFQRTPSKATVRNVDVKSQPAVDPIALEPGFGFEQNKAASLVHDDVEDVECIHVYSGSGNDRPSLHQRRLIRRNREQRTGAPRFSIIDILGIAILGKDIVHDVASLAPNAASWPRSGATVASLCMEILRAQAVDGKWCPRYGCIGYQGDHLISLMMGHPIFD